MHVAQNTAKTMKQKCQKPEVWHGSTICQKSEFKGREHILFLSLLAIIDVWWPLVTWLWINSAPRVSERQARPAMLCPRRDWLRSDMLHDSFQRQQPAGPASLPNLHTHSLECQPSVLYWELGLAVLVTGLRWTADGAFCPAAPWGQVERVRETGVFMFHLLPPPLPPHRGRDGCPWHWFWRRRDRESDKGNRKGTCDGGRERKMGCDGMKIDLIKSAQYKSIEASCRMQSVTKAPPLCIWFPPLTYGLRQETHFQEIHFSQCSPSSLE